ncbi:MAG: hypothetical protein DRH56_04365, partial [Deltaproteobacteria bacterium]
VGGGIGTISAAGLFDAATVGTGSVTATSSLGPADTSGNVIVTHGAAKKMTLDASKTTIASDQKGSATLTATILDNDDNVISDDNTTVVTFSLSDTTYLTLSSTTATAASGVAHVTVTSKAGTVPSPPAHSNASITAGTLTPPAAVTLTIVNFSIQVDAPAATFVDGTGLHLVTSGSTPSTATFSGVGGNNGDYRWALSSVGTIDSTSADTIHYTAPAAISGVTEVDHLTLTSATDPNLTDTIDITIHNPVAVTSPEKAMAIAVGGSGTTVTATGATGVYKFQSSGTTVATVDADTGIVTPVAAGTVVVQARDAVYGDFAVENGYFAQTPQIEVVNPIVINGTPPNDAMESGTTNAFTATGGKVDGQVDWESSAGSISADGVFTAPTVTAGTSGVTITAYDKTYNKAHYSPISTTYHVTVYAAAGISQTPAGYTDGTPATYPLLTPGVTTVLTPADTNRTYDWSITDWTGASVGTAASGTAQYNVDPDVLFAAHGAGVYTVTMKDHTHTGFAAATLNVRVPMRLAATKFAAASKPDEGTYKVPADAGDTYTVTGGPAGGVYQYTALDLNGAESAAGAFFDPSPTDADNLFNFGAGITELMSYRVKVSLDDASTDADVTRLIDAGLGDVLSGIFRVVPTVTYNGTVVEKADGATPVGGVTVVATHDATVTSATATDGIFSIGPFDNTGVTYSFYVFKDGYIDKTVTGSDIQSGPVLLEALATGSGSIDGTITLSGDPAPFASGTVSIKAKTAAGAYVTDGDGKDITVLADPSDGSYSFPVPAAFTGDGPFTLEARMDGYVFDETAGLGILANVALAGTPPAAAGADLTLFPVTTIDITGTPVDSDADGVSDQVQVKITAEAGQVPARFDGTATEVRVLDADGNDLASELDAFGSAGTNTWSFTHNAYENFTITVYADVGEDRDVDAGYKATKEWTYVKSATTPAKTTVTNPTTNGGSADSASGDTHVNLPPGGLTGDVRSSVTFSIVEADPAAAGATKITGSTHVVEVVLTEPSGDPVNNDDLQRIEITLKFDPTVVTTGTLEAGTYVIYQAANMSDMVAGNATAVPVSQIILPIDYANGFVTFWVNHLSVFGIGGGGGSVAAGGGGGGGGCFIATAAYGSLLEPHVKILRDFRDVYLMPNRLGHAFVEAYYRYSPPIAASIARHDVVRAVVRVGLMPLIGFSYVLLHTSPMEKMLILLLMMAMFGAMGWLLIRRRRRPAHVEN